MAPVQAPPLPGEGAALNDRARGALSPLPRPFYARPSPEVARDVLGRLLVRVLPGGGRLVGRIVECEAYQEGDPASHSYRGRTARTEVMFGPPGHLYVYLSYGMHHCMNVVAGRDGEGSAVLLRAVEPLEGLEEMAELRGLADPRRLCTGPGRLTQAFAIGREHNGIDLVKGDVLFVAAGSPLRDGRVLVGPRVGLTVGRETPWRFADAGSPFVSRRRRAGASRGKGPAGLLLRIGRGGSPRS